MISSKWIWLVIQIIILILFLHYLIDSHSHDYQLVVELFEYIHYKMHHVMETIQPKIIINKIKTNTFKS